MYQIAQDTDLERLESVFDGPRDFRTVGGIARAAELDINDVHALIALHPELFNRASLTIGGEPVYSLRSKEYSSESRVLERRV